MAAVGRSRLPFRGFPHDSQFVHQLADELGVDHAALTFELLGEAAIAVGRPSAGHFDQGVAERPVLVRSGCVVDAAAGHAQYIAEH
jgi:hypothetical protein